PVLQLAEALTDGADDLDGVGPGLPPDLQQHRARAVDVRNRLGVGLAILDARDVADPNRVAGHFTDHDVGELASGLHTAAGAEGHRLRPLIHAAAGNLDVLRLQRAGDLGDRQVVGAQPIAVQPDVDLPRPAAEHQHLADAADALELPAQHLVGVLGDL